MNDLRLATIELMQEIAYMARHATWRGLWAWLTEDNGIRLIMLTVIIPLLLIGEHYHWWIH